MFLYLFDVAIMKLAGDGYHYDLEMKQILSNPQLKSFVLVGLELENFAIII